MAESVGGVLGRGSDPHQLGVCCKLHSGVWGDAPIARSFAVCLCCQMRLLLWKIVSDPAIFLRYFFVVTRPLGAPMSSGALVH